MPHLLRRLQPPALLTLLLALIVAFLFGPPAHADGSVRVEWMKGPNVISAEVVTSSGSSVQSLAAPNFGGVAGSVRLTVVDGAAVIRCCEASPTATQTNGFRLQVGDSAYTLNGLSGGTKLAVIESANAPAGPGGTGGGSGTAGTEYTEDAGAPGNPVGGMEMCRRRDTLTGAEVSADGDVIAGNCTAKGERTVRDADVIAQLAILDGRVDGLEGQLTSALSKLDTVITNTDRSADVAESTAPTAVKIDQTTPGTTDGITLKNVGVQGTGSTFDPPTGGSGLLGFLSDIAKAIKGTLTVQGGVAQGVAPSGNGFRLLCRYESAGLSSVAANRMQDVSCSPYGGIRMQISSPDSANNFAQVTGVNGTTSNPGMNGLASASFSQVNTGANQWDPLKGDPQGAFVQLNAGRAQRWAYAAAASGITSTTFVNLKAAAAASTKNCFSGLQISTTTLGAGTEFVIRDGAGGTVLWRMVLGTAALPLTSINLPSPICGSDATLMEAGALTNPTSGAIYVNVQGHTQF